MERQRCEGGRLHSEFECQHLCQSPKGSPRTPKTPRFAFYEKKILRSRGATLIAVRKKGEILF